MNCKYFILSKHNDDKNIITLNNKLNYILPDNNITDYITHDLYENTLIDWCKQFMDTTKTFLDIGAHTGTYAVTLSDCFNKVYAFEPQKMTYYALCGTVCLSNKYNVECINSGLGSVNQIGNNILNIISIDGGGSTVGDVSNNLILRKETININTLDSYNIDNIGFIKIDIEGNELNALKGGEETLKRSNYPKILFECNEYVAELFEYLESLGYEIHKINGCVNMYLATH